MLIEAYKKHNEWLKIAKSLCNNPSYAEDVVQDMYVKLSTVSKDINDSYIRMIIRNLVYDQSRIKTVSNFKNVNIDNLKYLSNNRDELSLTEAPLTIEPDENDEDLKYLLRGCFITEDKESVLTDRDIKILRRYDKLPEDIRNKIKDKESLTYRQLADKYNACHIKIFRDITKARKKIING